MQNIGAKDDGACMNRQLAGLSILMTVTWVIVVVTILWSIYSD